MNSSKSSKINSVLTVIYFFMAPIYSQPFIPAGAWAALKMFALVGVVLVLFVSVIRAKKVVFGLNDFISIITVVVAAFYLLRGMDIAVSTVAAYLFYFIGKNQRGLTTDSAFFTNITWIARLSGIYVVFLLLLAFSGGSADLVTAGINRNNFGLYLAVVAAILFFIYGRERKLLDVALLVVVGFMILYGGSRGALVLFVALFLVYICLNRDWKSIYGLIALSVISFVLFLEPSQLEDVRIYQQYLKYTHGADLDLSSGRLEGYQLGIELLMSSMITGVGDVNLHEYGLGYTQIHNFYLRVLVEGGILLFVTVMCWLLAIGVELCNSLRPMRDLAMSCALLLFLPMFVQPSGLLGNFMISGLLWYLIGHLASQRARSIHT